MNHSQEVLTPGVFWYEAGLPENLPSFVGDDFNLGASAHAASPLLPPIHALVMQR
jgi:hypothetical protein